MMKKLGRMFLGLCIIGLIIFPGAIANAASSEDVPRMSVETLKDLLEDPESEVVVLDVRTGSSWKDDDMMIASAVREEPGELASWIEKYTPEQTLVLYCT